MPKTSWMSSDFLQLSVANDLSGLLRLPLEVTNARDRDATGDPEDAI